MRDIFFLRTAKTGSSSIAQWCMRHETHITNNMIPLDKGENSGLKEKLQEKKYYVFTLVRNPFTRAISCWQQAKRIEWIEKELSFEDYLKIPFHRILHPHYMTHSIPLADYLENYIGQFDKVVKLETIQKDMDEICDLLELEKSPIRHDRPGKYPASLLEEYNNPKIVDAVREVFKVDFETFNYSKDFDTSIVS